MDAEDMGEKIKEKAHLTANGVGVLAVGAPLLITDGLAHFGWGGLFVAAACMLVAGRHTEHMMSGGGKMVKKLIALPERSESRDSSDGRTFAEKLTGKPVNPKRNVIQARKQNDLPEGSILIGTDARGKQVHRTWKELKSILILGLAEGGKSTTAAWLIAQCIRDGASIVIIDKHGRSDESLTARLSPFESFFACQPARIAKDAFRNAVFVKNELDSRIEGESLCDVPLVLVIDEFSDIMKQVALGRGEWLEIGEELVSLIEEINTQGRKYRVFVVAIGQIANASRSGGTEIRDLFHTRMLHGMRESQAQMLIAKEYRPQVARLEKGQIFLDMEGKDEPFMVQIPLLSKKEMQDIALQCQDWIVEQFDKSDDVEEEDIGDSVKRADDVDIDLAVLVWNSGRNSVSKLMRTFKLTNHQAQKLRKMILACDGVDLEEGD